MGIYDSVPGVQFMPREEYFKNRGSEEYNTSDCANHIEQYTTRIFSPNQERHLNGDRAETVSISGKPPNEGLFQNNSVMADALNALFCQSLLSIVDLYASPTGSVEMFDRGGNDTFRDNFTAMYDMRLSFPQQLRTFNLFKHCGKADPPNAPCTVSDPSPKTTVQSLVLEGNAIAISHVNSTGNIETYVFFDSTDNLVPFIFSANVGLGNPLISAGTSLRAILDVFYRSYTMERSTYWLKLVTNSDGISITGAGKSQYPSAAKSASIYTGDATVFTLEHVPPVFRGLRNVETLFKGKTMIHNEYARYCDPHAKVNFDSPVDSVIHKSIQLLGLVHTILPNLSKEPARFSRSMAAAAQRLNSDEDQLLGIMTLMRSLQVDGEFERYFKVPVRRKRHPTQYRTVIADNQKYVDNWVTPNLPTSSIVPAPRII